MSAYNSDRTKSKEVSLCGTERDTQQPVEEYVSVEESKMQFEEPALGVILDNIDKLKLHCKTIEKITAIAKNDIGVYEEGASLEMMKEGLEDIDTIWLAKALIRNSTLQVLRILGNEIGDEGARALGEALQKNSTLKTLVLSHNSISDLGGQSIGEALSKNHGLKELDLDFNRIGVKGARAIGEGLSKNNTLEILGLMDNPIMSDGARAIGGGLKKNCYLKTLRLYKNDMRDEGALSLVESLSQNDTLETLEIRENNIRDDGMCAIASAIRDNSALRDIRLDGNLHRCKALLALAKTFRVHSSLHLITASPKGTYWYPENYDAWKGDGIEIGHGEFGSVHLIKLRGQQVVQKISRCENVRDEIYEQLILQGLPVHENVVQLDSAKSNRSVFLAAHQGGSLKDFALKYEGGIPLSQFFKYTLGMSSAIQHLHSHGLIHRDIAARNYVLSDDLESVVLVDFGLSWPLEEKENFVSIRPDERLPWRQMSPEVLRTLTYSRAADIWQLCLTFWQLFQQARQPFSTLRTIPQLAAFLKRRMVDEAGHIPISFHKNGVSVALKKTVKELVLFCSHYEPASRPSANEIVEKIETLQRNVNFETCDVVEEGKEIVLYEPSDEDVMNGLQQYMYTDYYLSDGGDYVDVKKTVEDYNCDYEYVEDFPDSADMEEEYRHFLGDVKKESQTVEDVPDLEEEYPQLEKLAPT